MNIETIKSIILFVLVGISFMLTYILWSYQPNYDYFYDASYVNEVDIGGVEKSRNELIQPKQIVFRNENNIFSFIDPKDEEGFYQEISSVVLYNYQILDASGRPDSDEYIEIIYPTAIPVEVIISLFTFEDGVVTPSWSFERIFLTKNEQNRTIQLIVLSEDGNKQLTATIEKTETYEQFETLIEGHSLLEEYVVVGEENPIYIPKNEIKLPSKTLVAGWIEPEEFVNALFANPNLVTSNMKEAYFTDGQRGMRILDDGRKLEFINPIQSTVEEEDSTPLQLIDQSITNINEHKGWTNNFVLDDIDLNENKITYRLYYDGYPIYDFAALSVMKQAWKGQVLFEYERPLIQVGNLLNIQEKELLSGENLMDALENNRNYDLEDVQDIVLGYELNYVWDNHSLVLEPNWYIKYDDDWMKYHSTEDENLSVEGGD